MRNQSRTLFETVPRRCHLAFWDDGQFSPGAVAKFLDLNKADIAKVSGVSAASVRFDRKIPREVLERLTQIANVCELVAEHFGGDASRTALWLKTNNPLLGNICPREMIRLGRREKLQRFVMDALKESGTASQSAMPQMPMPLQVKAGQIATLCRRYGVQRLAAFGSVVRGDFDPLLSDIDFVVEFGTAQGQSPAQQYFGFKAALEHLFDRRIDLVELAAVPPSRLRRAIERTQMPIYEQAA